MRKPFTGIIAVLMLSVLWAPCPAQAAFPGENGKIAFMRIQSSCPGCDDHIVTMSSDGTGQTDLGPGSHPAWSPDGLKLAFTDGFRVFVANADGTGVTQVLFWGTQVGGITWSPDGQKLAAALETCDNNECRLDIYRFNLDGSGLVDLTPDVFEERDPSWSPDGSKIAFGSARNGDYDVFVASAVDGTGLNDLTNNPATDRNPSWSPDGAKIAFSRQVTNRSDIYVMNGDGSGQTNLTSVQGNAFRDGPAWSPDGSAIAFHGAPCQQISLVSANGAQESDCLSHPPSGRIDLEPDWQPRGADGGAGGYPRPRGATPLFTYLVPAYSQCSASNSTHGAPLSFPSCAPPAQTSGTLTVGTPDANGLAARSVSNLRLNALPGNPTTPADEADVEILFGASDVRWAANLLPYNGEVSLRLSLRITDKDNSGATPGGTVVDVPLSFTAPCDAGTCGIDTTTDSLAPGTAKEGRRAIWELGQVQVYDGGPDADAGTEPNSLFETQGLFVP